MEQTIEQYLQANEKSGKADAATMMAAMGAIATAGQMWNALPPEQKTIDNARKISHDSLEPVKGGREADTTNLLFDKAGTRSMVQAYTKDLVSRSESLDKSEGKEIGIHLMGFLDGVGAAVKDIDFSEFKKGNLVNLDGTSTDLLAVRQKISATVVQHIDPNMKPIDQDMITTIKKDLDGDKKIFNDVKIEPKELSLADNLRVGGLMLTYAAALTPKSGEASKEQEAGKDGPDPKSEGKMSGEFRLRSEDEIVAFAKGMPKSNSPEAQPLLAAAGSNISQGNQQQQRAER